MRRLRRWIGWAMVLVLVGSIVTWYVTRETLPSRIRLATALPGGLYHEIGSDLARQLATHTGKEVEAVSTAGSLENRKKLLAGDVDLAILQAGTVPSDGLAALAPLYEDVMCVVVRRGRDITSVRDLAGRSVIFGPEGSGMREQALRLLTHYRIKITDTEVSYLYFSRMMKDETIDAAIITTGLMNPDLNRLLGTGEFDLVPILDAEAIAMRHPLFQRFEVPRGLFYERPAIPSEPIVTVATTAVLAARKDASGLLVRETLATVYETAFPANLPTMIPKSEASERSGLPLHPAARSYFNPYEGIDLLSNFMESIAAVKELLFALVAGIYLLWDRLRRLKAKREAVQVAAQKKVLWKFLDETARIEREQMSIVDVDALEVFLDDVTNIKLRALDELTHHDLRGDRSFLIFLIQCGNLIRKIQAKIDAYSQGFGRSRKEAQAPPHSVGYKPNGPL